MVTFVMTAALQRDMCRVRTDVATISLDGQRSVFPVGGALMGFEELVRS